MLAHDVNAGNQKKFTSNQHDTTYGIHNTINNTDDIYHCIAQALTTRVNA